MPFFDGARGPIYYRHWAAEVPRANVVFLHGYGEHSGLYHRFADSLSADGIDVWALDLIGHGLSSGDRGDFGSLRDLQADADALTSLARVGVPDVPTVVIGHSLGSVVATLSVLDEPDRYVAAVISGATLAPIPWLDPDNARFDLDPSELSADPFYLDALINDPLAFVSADSGRLLGAELRTAWDRFDADLAALRVSTLAVHGDADTVSPIENVRTWAGRVRELELREIAGARHDVLNETGHRRTAAVVADFVLERADAASLVVYEEETSWRG
ncbi:alpha/beta fold hydrolase [Rhodococcus sp. 14-2470-1a]|uniref:alpha/beta fold hydrolase n=1 Tax=Rhodococcus sp. 14-2470-1a TaxID=2023150 RepID=UPI000B9C1DCB|nr:alpha/beta fold hydrolase [Rhodococcus sp. 14-2470-1a]OZF54257.1 lysophospholipase [Rhodococcus sp. 14-2470-1a]